MKYNICVIQPEGYIHSAAFVELAELVASGLQDLGHVVTVWHNRILDDARNIMIGCHLLDPAFVQRVPASTVIINTEQIADDRTDWNEHIFKWVSLFETWDYSEKNLLKLREVGAKSPRILRIGFHKNLVRIPKPMQQDIDVLFYGSMGDRRQKIIEDLRKRGCNVHAVFGVYGKKRDELIARAKVLLNMHHYNSHIFEIVRVFYLMTNSKAVVSEIGDRTSIDPRYLEGIHSASYESLVDSCLELVTNEQARVELERRSVETIRKMPQGELMRSLVTV